MLVWLVMATGEVTGWLRRKRLDERAFLFRYLEINTALALRFRTEGAPGTTALTGPHGASRRR